MAKRRNYKVIGEFEMTGKQAEEIDQKIEEAEKEIEESRVYFRWKKEQLDMVKKAAALMGVPYQSYMKTVLIKQSVEDIKKIQEVL